MVICVPACTVVDWASCGGKPTVSNNTAILSWISANGSFGHNVSRAELELTKVDNAWNQIGCFNLGEAISMSGNVSSFSNYTIPSNSVDYDSLYIARLQWVDSAGNKHLVKDGDCYFTLQPSELVFVCIHIVQYVV